MILFKREHVVPILSGRKTQTRRLGKKRWYEGTVHECRVGYTGKPFARVRVIRVRVERLGDITNADAAREGFANRAEFINSFRQIYGPVDTRKAVWVIDFRVEK